MREQFEKLFPVPEGVVFEDNEYKAVFSGHDYTYAVRRDQSMWANRGWKCFQAGHAAGLEAAAAECDKQEKSLYSTLNGNSDAIPSSIGAGICAAAIRAMKGEVK